MMAEAVRIRKNPKESERICKNLQESARIWENLLINCVQGQTMGIIPKVIRRNLEMVPENPKASRQTGKNPWICKILGKTPRKAGNVGNETQTEKLSMKFNRRKKKQLRICNNN